MKGIKDRVAIIGMGCSKFGENWNKSAGDMLIDAVYEAYDDAGIEPDDIPRVVYRYATSKISKIKDLKYKITLGFRGEALYAISQVSKLTIISSTDKIEDGFKAMFIAGKLKDYKPHPHPKGTTVKVKLPLADRQG